MIHVDPQPEPSTFEQRVRVPGRRFLSTNTNPTSRQWASHSYWRNVSRELHDQYGGICAYSCHWIPYDTGADTIEHFQAKNKFPNLAYEWRNYRLVCATLNGRKGVYDDVLDPFQLQNGWFVIDFPSLLVKPAGQLDPVQAATVKATINRLRLNDEGTCLRSRHRYVTLYCNNEISWGFLQREAPFIARELDRQALIDQIRNVFII